MTTREILKMGDPRLLRVAAPVEQFDIDQLHLLITVRDFTKFGFTDVLFPGLEATQDD